MAGPFENKMYTHDYEKESQKELFLLFDTFHFSKMLEKKSNSCSALLESMFVLVFS